MSDSTCFHGSPNENLISNARAHVNNTREIRNSIIGQYILELCNRLSTNIDYLKHIEIELTELDNAITFMSKKKSDITTLIEEIENNE